MISSNCIFNLTKFCVIVSFLTNLLTLGNSLSIAVRAVKVALLVILGVLFLISFILLLREALEANLVILGTSTLT